MSLLTILHYDGWDPIQPYNLVHSLAFNRFFWHTKNYTTLFILCKSPGAFFMHVQ